MFPPSNVCNRDRIHFSRSSRISSVPPRYSRSKLLKAFRSTHHTQIFLYINFISSSIFRLYRYTRRYSNFKTRFGELYHFRFVNLFALNAKFSAFLTIIGVSYDYFQLFKISDASLFITWQYILKSFGDGECVHCQTLPFKWALFSIYCFRIYSTRIAVLYQYRQGRDKFYSPA